MEKSSKFNNILIESYSINIKNLNKPERAGDYLDEFYREENREYFFRDTSNHGVINKIKKLANKVVYLIKDLVANDTKAFLFNDRKTFYNIRLHTRETTQKRTLSFPMSKLNLAYKRTVGWLFQKSLDTFARKPEDSSFITSYFRINVKKYIYRPLNRLKAFFRLMKIKFLPFKQNMKILRTAFFTRIRSFMASYRYKFRYSRKKQGLRLQSPQKYNHRDKIHKLFQKVNNIIKSGIAFSKILLASFTSEYRQYRKPQRRRYRVRVTFAGGYRILAPRSIYHKILRKVKKKVRYIKFTNWKHYKLVKSQKHKRKITQSRQKSKQPRKVNFSSRNSSRTSLIQPMTLYKVNRRFYSTTKVETLPTISKIMLIFSPRNLLIMTFMFIYYFTITKADCAAFNSGSTAGVALENLINTLNLDELQEVNNVLDDVEANRNPNNNLISSLLIAIGINLVIFSTVYYGPAVIAAIKNTASNIVNSTWDFVQNIGQEAATSTTHAFTQTVTHATTQARIATLDPHNQQYIREVVENLIARRT